MTGAGVEDRARKRQHPIGQLKAGLQRLHRRLPAAFWIYDVELEFEVSAQGKPPDLGTRLGRFVLSWAGEATTLCPGVRPWTENNGAPVDPYVPGGDTCSL